jgi:hypothetical protein
MGLTDADVRDLRDQMIGTPTMSGAADGAALEQWGEKTKALIDQGRGAVGAGMSTSSRLMVLAGGSVSRFVTVFVRLVGPQGRGPAADRRDAGRR